MTGKGASQMLDTPDLRRVKKTQKIYSQVKYAKLLFTFLNMFIMSRIP